MFVVMHDGTLGERALPDGRGGVVFAQPGVPFEVDDEVAGVAPGPWEPADADVVRDEEGRDVSGQYAHEPVEGPDGAVVWRRRHLGGGLLAQESVFRAATDDEVAALDAAPDGGDDA